MARIPEGAELVDNPVSKAPGFRIGNVIVMAGVPGVMQAMLDHAIQGVKGGALMLSANVEADGLPEGIYGDALRGVAEARPEVSIGSYPSFIEGRFRNQIVVRSRDAGALEEAKAAVEAMLARLKGDAKPL
jgi:molybdopterin-biosynthesis enzyme MoeA-like protein